MPTLVQLYSARNLQSVECALDQIAAAGFDGVEGCSLNFDNAEALREKLDMRGLTMPQAHMPLAMLEDRIEQARNLCRTLGVHTVIVPWLSEEERPETAVEWRELGVRLNKISKKLQSFGLRFAWHNHDFELAQNADGITPMELLLRLAPGMDWEVDIGWILHAGQDPIKWLTSFASRIVAVHIKDLQKEGGWADLGHGATDWLPIFRALKSMPRLAANVAEDDQPADFQRFVSRWKIAYDRLSASQLGRPFDGITHVAIKVQDIDRQLNFYTRVMGFDQMFRLNNEDGSLFLVYLRINDRQYLELFPDATGDATPTPDARGYQHICLDVIDLQSTVEMLRSRGARMCLWREDQSGIYEVYGTGITMGRDGNRQSWLKDPEGNRIELMELALGGLQYSAMAERISVPEECGRVVATNSSK